MGSCVTVITEVWLNSTIPDRAIELAGHTDYQADRTADSAKCRGGGMCFYLNSYWCTAADIIGKHCSQDLEYLVVKCRPFYLSRESSAILITAVYIPSHAQRRL